jgi:protein-S-isoprenylcysteine O-methyltransferase Ste14
MSYNFVIIIWIISSAGLIIISRKSLLAPRSHGFFRFFAWEILLGMFLLNAATWFQNPWAWHQLISWALLIVSLVLVIQGLKLFREIGKQDTGRNDVPLLELEKTSTLITIGLYRFIRHPMYSSLMFLGWGIFFKSPSWLDAGLALFCTFFLTATARAEEQENISYFGKKYVEYMKQSKMFVPFIY